MQSFLTERKAAERIYKKAPGPVDLVMGAVKVEKLYITSLGPGDDPHTLTVNVIDRRWLFTRQHLVKTYNLRKRTGEIRVDGNKRIEIATSTSAIAYASWSLNRGKPWKFKEVVEDILKTLGLKEDEYAIPDELGKDVNVQDLDIDTSGESALEGILSLAGGIGVWCDYEGKIVIKDMNDGTEANEMSSAEIIGGGRIEVSDRAAERPKEVRVLFNREVELRFDYDEDEAGAAAASTTAEEEDRAPRDMQNVLPQTDINFPGASRGNWIELVAYLNGLPSTPDYSIPAHAPGPLDIAFLRKSYLNPAWPKYLYVHDTNGNIDQVWSRRIQTVRRCFRRVFRINKVWRDKIRQFKAYRTSVVDIDTFTRGHAEAFMDYTAFPSERSLFVTRKDSDRTLEGWVVEGYAEDLDEATPAPADVGVVDPDNGIISVSLVTGPYGEETDVIPGQVDGLPELTDVGTAYGMIRGGFPLKTGFKVATILTCIMAAPNDNGRLHEITIKPKEIEPILGHEVGECNGPPLTLRVGGSDRTSARFCWIDDHSAAIDEAFFEGTEWPEPTFLNKDEIQAFAEAAAAQVYSAMRDKAEGSATYSSRAARPVGSISGVSHRVSQRGVATTSLFLAAQIVPRDFAEFLPASVRRVLTGALIP